MYIFSWGANIKGTKRSQKRGRYSANIERDERKNRRKRMRRRTGM